MYRTAAPNKRSLDNGGEMLNMDGAANKRQQMADMCQPSRVLLLRNLARGVTELDVEAFILPFTRGVAPKVYLHASAGHAFVEFVNEGAAAEALDYFTCHPIELKGSMVHVAFSRRDAVTTMDENMDPFRVVLVSVTNVMYSVDIDTTHMLFNRFGPVEKIVTFSRTPNMYQALVQFQHAEHARQAMMRLHNRNMYDGCNTLQIQRSKLQELVVKGNSSRSWDYTTGEMAPPHVESRGSSMMASNSNGGPGVLPTPLGGGSVSQYSPQPPAGHLPPRGSMGGYQGSMHGMEVHGGGCPGMRGESYGSLLSSVSGLPWELRDLNLDEMNRNMTPVLICYNIPTLENLVPKLFNLFSLYGTVLRIKLLRDKKETALIQYSTALYSTIAFVFLQQVKVKRQEIQVHFSKNHEVKISPQLSEECGEEGKRAKIFQIRDQRYGYGDDSDKYLRSACKPTNTLFVANIHEEATEEEMTALFSSEWVVTKFQFRAPKEGSKTHMAVLEMGSVEEATDALMCLHNHDLHGRSIKVSFSKAIIN